VTRRIARTERRRSERYRLDLPVRFRLYLASRPDDSRTTFFPARLYDISRHGVSFLTDTVEHRGLHFFHPTVPFSERCTVEVELPGTGEPILVQGRIVWYDKAEPGSPYAFRAGLEWIDPPSSLAKDIQTLLRRGAGAPKGS